MATAAKKPTASKQTAPKDELPFALPQLVDLLEAGAHFGHERSKRNPKMEQYIFMQRNRVAIFDLEQTLSGLEKAAKFAYQVARNPSAQFLFVGTKRQARAIVHTYAEAIEQPYVTKRWLGGTLTNFATILKSIEKLEQMKSQQKTPAWEKMSKKEKSVRGKEIERLESVLDGMRSQRTLPAVLVAVGAHDERLAVREAKRIGIPIIGITDTNADPSDITYPIPANDDALRSIDLIVSVLAKAIASARGKTLAESK
jgi:small subunit ribosomal protein S2